MSDAPFMVIVDGGGSRFDYDAMQRVAEQIWVNEIRSGRDIYSGARIPKSKQDLLEDEQSHELDHEAIWQCLSDHIDLIDQVRASTPGPLLVIGTTVVFTLLTEMLLRYLL